MTEEVTSEQRMAVTSDYGVKILEALGLPANTGSLLIRFDPGNVVRIEATLYPSREQLGALGDVFRTSNGKPS